MTKTLMGSDDLAMCRKVGLTLILYPVIFSHKSKPCPPSNGFNLDPKDNRSLLTLMECLTLMEKRDINRVGVPFLMITILLLFASNQMLGNNFPTYGKNSDQVLEKEKN